jgi:HEAT repeat protein
MWEAIAISLALGGAYLVDGFRNYRRRLREWHNAASLCGLQIVGVSNPLAWRLKLQARSGPMEVRIEVRHGKDYATWVVVTGPVGFYGVRIRREQNRSWGPREIEIGDDRFDSTFWVEGPVQLVGLLNAEMRRLLLRVNSESRFEIADGELRAGTFDQHLPNLLPRLLEIAQRFAQRVDAAQCLAENAHRDPEAGVRLQNLLLLIRELPRNPRVTEALRTACSDPSPEIRLRAARELGAEGRKVLLELAESTEDDACSAQAVSSLGRELGFERTRAILLLALRRRRIETARVCLEALGRSGEAAAVNPLAKVLAREQGELAAAAAQALGATRSAAAEPPLIPALQREQMDVQVAAANALARVGSAAAVLPLKEAARSAHDPELRRATRQAIAEIQSRLQGASPGQLSLAGAEAGQLSLAEAEAGQLTLATDSAGQLSLSGAEEG